MKKKQRNGVVSVVLVNKKNRPVNKNAKRKLIQCIRTIPKQKKTRRRKRRLRTVE